MPLPLAEIGAFHVVGAVFVLWALLLAVLGFRSPNFPSNIGGQRVVIAISLLLMLGSIGSAIYTAIHEEDDTEGHSKEGPTPASDNAPRD
jgi:hypothetical protein